MKELAAELRKYKQVFVVCDRNVEDFARRIRHDNLLPITADEGHKTMDTVMNICRWLRDCGADRDALVLAADEEETATVSKNMLPLADGDVIDFLCDYYRYDGTYEDSYYLGEQYIVNGTPEISDVYVDASAASATYRFTDMYQQHYWSPFMY